MKHWNIGLVLAVIILVGAVAYLVRGNAVMESFEGNDKNKLMFNGSYPTPPVVCLSGRKKIPCTAFSGA